MKYSSLMLFPIALALAASASAGPTIGPDNAEGFIGKDATVCGKAESARYNENSDGQPTFIHFGAPFPRHKFAVRIDGTNRASFTPAPEELVGKMVCFAGRIGRAAGNRPEMKIDSPAVMQVL